MLGLRATTDLLKINIGSAADIRVSVNAVIADSAGPPAIKAFPNLGPVAAQTGTGDVTIVDTSGGTSGDLWNIKDCSIFNAHASNTTLVKAFVYDGSNTSYKAQATLLPSESLILLESGAWLHFDANGGVYPAAFNVLSVQDIVATGTYTPTTGMKWVMVIGTGSGGGGGGSDTSAAGSGDVGVGAGGGGGETRIGFFSAATIGASQSVTVNATGTAGSATNGTGGGNGGTVVLGALLTCNGGTGGGGSGATTQDSQSTAGGAGGTGGSGGTIGIDGGDGSNGIAFSVDGTTDTSSGLGGDGGPSWWGGGGRGGNTASTTITNAANVAGTAGKARGAGGGGGVTTNSTTGAAGGAGKVGGFTFIEFS